MTRKECEDKKREKIFAEKGIKPYPVMVKDGSGVANRDWYKKSLRK